ncbi:hypothetical protein DFR70_110187 [Nocardia tenerifensis]|uniref:Uncharacterized protein n=1 Tax=Nocardia tenerifensis TaxID=228006 RepID=A0A318K015_9NOCA|nr:hypothetical protein DFR70_110187 [Nocardia tenerifensis]
MPETAMNEQDNSPTGENEIGFSRQAPVMQAIPQADRMQITSNGHFGSGVS